MWSYHLAARVTTRSRKESEEESEESEGSEEKSEEESEEESIAAICRAGCSTVQNAPQSTLHCALLPLLPDSTTPQLIQTWIALRLYQPQLSLLATSPRHHYLL